MRFELTQDMTPDLGLQARCVNRSAIASPPHHIRSLPEYYESFLPLLQSMQPIEVTCFSKPIVQKRTSPIDNAAFWTFHGGHLRPFPPGTPAPQADVYISLHYILTHPHGQPVVAAAASTSPKAPFTITNDAVPLQNTAVNKMLQRACTGMEVRGGQWPNSIIGEHKRVTAIFYRKPDGTSWVKWMSDGDIEQFIPVTELGTSAQWSAPIMTGMAYYRRYLRYAVWPDGGDRLSGVLDGGEGLDGTGVINMTCQTETVPQITSTAAWESH